MTRRRVATDAPVRWLTRTVTGLAPNLRSLRWAVRQLRDVHRRLPIEGAATRIPLAAGMGPRGWWGIRIAFIATQPTCLERALLLQAWMGGYTDAPDVVIGVRKASGGVEAHAWIEDRDPLFDPSYTELTRLAP